MQPRRRTYKKWHKGNPRARWVESDLQWGHLGLRAEEPGRLTARQLESGRRSARRHLPRRARVWVRPFPDRPVTGLSVGTRMGKGKGAVQYWAQYVQAGQILYEVAGADRVALEKRLRRTRRKLPVKTRLVHRNQPLI